MKWVWLKSTKLNIQSKEVSKVFSPSIYSLTDPKTKKIKDSILLEQKVQIPFFNLKNEVVWGATSMILSEFKKILKGITWTLDNGWNLFQQQIILYWFVFIFFAFIWAKFHLQALLKCMIKRKNIVTLESNLESHLSCY